jgi:hypothetical protein
MPDSEIVLSEFQHRAEEAIRKLLASLGRTVESRQVLRGVVPFYSPEPQTVLKLQSADFELWLYDDEASFSSVTGGGAVERLDFKSEPELLSKLLQQIEDSLRGK